MTNLGLGWRLFSKSPERGGSNKIDFYPQKHLFGL